MIEVYKIMTGKDKIDGEQFFPLADSNYGLQRIRDFLLMRYINLRLLTYLLTYKATA